MILALSWDRGLSSHCCGYPRQFWMASDREFQCCTENPFCIPSSCKQGSDETCSQHTEDFTPVLYSEDKSSILISKAIKLTLQIIKFRPQKQEKKLTSFIPVNDTVVCAPTFQGTRWESGRTKKKLPIQGLMCLRLLQTPHGNSGAERARNSQLAVKAGSTEEISDKKRALPSLDTNHNQTISGSSQTLIFPLESHNTAGSKSPPSITWPQEVTTLYLGQKSAIYYISTYYTAFGRQHRYTKFGSKLLLYKLQTTTWNRSSLTSRISRQLI